MKRTATGLILLLSILLLPLTLSACAEVSKEPVGRCAEQEILYDELRFQTLMFLEQNENCSEEDLRLGVEKALREHYAILALAKEYMPDLNTDSDVIQSAVDAAVENAINSQGGKSAYKKMLKERYLTEDLMRRMLAVTQLQIELEKKIHAGTELENTTVFEAWLKDGNLVRARRIFFPAEMEDAEGIASAARITLMGGANLSEVLTEEQIDAGAKLYSADYFFRGLNGTDLELAALDLRWVGDVSNVIADGNGYSILIRVEDPLTESSEEQPQNEQSFKALADTAFTRFREKRLSALVSAAAEKLTIEWNELGKSTVLSEID